MAKTKRAKGICSMKGCQQKLSIYNTDVYCASCFDKIPIGERPPYREVDDCDSEYDFSQRSEEERFQHNDRAQSHVFYSNLLEAVLAEDRGTTRI